MSGFVGIANLDYAPLGHKTLESMVRRMAYTGPDGLVTWTNPEGTVGFGHASFRVSEWDISQPITVGPVTVAAHIRLDGRQELIRRLNATGQQVDKNTPDVVLLAKAYISWNVECLFEVFGDFAFILWDADKRRIFAARDHFGTKPLFYAIMGNTLIISTEMAAIRQHPLISTSLNDQAIGDFLILHDIISFDKTQTAFADIKRLPSAHWLQALNGEVSIKRYWLPPADTPMLRYRTEDQYVEHFIDVFKNTIKDRMQSKRILISLSGGLDSPSIAAMAARLVRTGEIDAQLYAWTMVYDRIHPDSEGQYARLVAQKLGIPHECFACDDFLMRLPITVRAEPTLSTFQSGLAEASLRKTSSLATTILDGQGADEVFRYSPITEILKGMSPQAALHLLVWEWRFMRRRPIGLRTLFNLKNWMNQPARYRLQYPTWLNPDFEQQMRLKERFADAMNWSPQGSNLLHPAAYRATMWPEWGPGTQFLNEPPVTPCETLRPFLDVRLLNFVFSLPPQPWFMHKYLLRRAFQNELPPEILERKKTPLGNLLRSLITQPGTEWIDEWSPVPELSSYVIREAIPAVGGSAPSRNPAIDLRPLALNEWLRQYKSNSRP